MKVLAPPQAVTCPYCQQAAYRLTGRLADAEPGYTRFGCDNAHYFVYPARYGYEPVLRREAA